MSEKITPESITLKLKEQGVLDSEETKKDTKEEKVSVSKTEEVLEEPAKESVTSEELSEVEQEAMKEGWKPEGEKSAEEFMRAKPLYEELKQRGKEIKNLTSQVDELAKHVGGLKKAGYEEKIDMINAEREDAVARSDKESLDYLDERLSEVKTEMSNEEEVSQAPAVAVEFMNRYQDIFKDPSLECQEIQNFITEQDNKLGTYDLDPETHIKTLEENMKAKFPKKFKVKEKQSEVSAVESDSRPLTVNKKSKYSFVDLNPHQKKVCEYMVSRGTLTKEEYIKQLVDTNGFK